MTDQMVERLKTRAHVNRIFAKKAAAGAEDTPRAPDLYWGRAEAFAEAADLIASTEVYQKALTFKELQAIRTLIAEDAQRKAAETAVDAGAAKRARIFMDGIGETLLPPPTSKTSDVLTDAADALSAIRSGYSLDASRDWKLLIAQLHSLAAMFKRTENASDFKYIPTYRRPRTGEEAEALTGNPFLADLLKDMRIDKP